MKKFLGLILLLILFAVPAQAMDYFVGTFAQCEAYIAKMDAMMGYPNARTGTLTYAKPIPHAKAPPLFMVPIKAVWGPKLGRRAQIRDIDANTTGAEMSARRSRATLKSEGAFDTDD